MNVLYYSGKTSNTHHFVTKLELPESSIHRISDEGVLSGPFPKSPVLILPTYADHTGAGAIPAPVITFLKANPAYHVSGLMASGNKFFGNTFALAGRLLSRRLRIPILFEFELRGMPWEHKQAREILEKHFQ